MSTYAKLTPAAAAARHVGNVGVRNDAVSSLQPVSGGVTHVGAPLDAHPAEDDLNAAADDASTIASPRSSCCAWTVSDPSIRRRTLSL